MIQLIKTIIGNILLAIHVYFDGIALGIEARHYFRRHTLQDFERNMIELGCTVVHAHGSIIFTTPHNVKLEVTESEIIINP